MEDALQLIKYYKNIKTSNKTFFQKKLFTTFLLYHIFISILINCNKKNQHFENKSQNYTNNRKNNEKNNSTKDIKLKIAIIGSGIGGLSTAYFLKKNKFLNIENIDVYERNSRLGGRVHSKLIFNRTENLGASFFIKKNKLIDSLIEELNLKKISLSENPDTSFGLFDENRIFFSLGRNKFINIIKMLWRYGFSILNEKTRMKNNLKKFSQIYDALNSRIIFSDVRQLVNFMGLEDLVIQSIKEYLISKNIDLQYIDEYANLLLKIIYNQQNDVNAFAGFITLIGGSYESFRVEGGNFQIIEKLSKLLIENSHKNSFGDSNHRLLFSNDAKVNILADHEVLIIDKKNLNKVSTKDDNHSHDDSSLDSYVISYKKLSSSNEEIFKKEYDIVILASPLEYSKIQFHKEVELKNTNLISKKNYYYFIKGKLKENLFIDYQTGDLPGNLISFNITTSSNIIYIKRLNNNNIQDEYRINSDEFLTDEVFLKYFENDYSIKYINHWDMAYPKLIPRNLDNLPSFILSENLYYLNAIESIGSCMELSMISGFNIVNLIENKYFPFKENKNFKSEEL